MYAPLYNMVTYTKGLAPLSLLVLFIPGAAAQEVSAGMIISFIATGIIVLFLLGIVGWCMYSEIMGYKKSKAANIKKEGELNQIFGPHVASFYLEDTRDWSLYTIDGQEIRKFRQIDERKTTKKNKQPKQKNTKMNIKPIRDFTAESLDVPVIQLDKEALEDSDDEMYRFGSPDDEVIDLSSL